jgi:predicted unusual protein kinase regulating ubiquinone biosynthesis (AarF/ABC1/UbiB family)
MDAAVAIGEDGADAEPQSLSLRFGPPAGESPVTDRPPTKGKRFLKLAGMTASVAGTYAKSRVKGIFQTPDAAKEERDRANAATGDRIARTLGELKGAVMKVGQMASIAADVLPAELTEALAGLQKEAPPMDYSVIEEQIEAELGDSPEALFRRFDRKPFASASIGQVHRAETEDGREVVVKVQYPGVDRAVDSDLSHLKVALRASGLIRVSKESLNASFDELRERLHEELDYCVEADRVRRFREFHAQHPYIAIPEVVGKRSSKRVLTLTYLAGDGLDAMGRFGYTQDERNLLGERLLTFMVSEIFEFGEIHGDPNPGNFAVRADGTLIIYDFGCVKVLPPKVVKAYRDTIVTALDEDYEGVEDGMQRLGVRSPGTPPIDPAYYKRWRDLFWLPFLDNGTFDFHTSTIHADVIAEIPGVIKRMKFFQPARDLIFLDRMVAGHYGNLRTMRARFPVLPVVQPYLDRL